MSKSKKLNEEPLRNAFNLVAASLITAYLSGPLLFAPLGDQTHILEADLGVTKEMIRRSTPANVNILYPEQIEARLYAHSQFSNSLKGLFQSYKDPEARPYDFFGITVNNLFIGPSSLLTTLSSNRLPNLTQCTVFIGSNRLTMEMAKRRLILIPDSAIKNIPGTIEDYRKLFLLHELEHCNQNFRERSDNEFYADQAAMKFFLEDGGNPDVVRAMIYMRSMDTMRAFLYDEGGSIRKKYTMGPSLAQTYLDGPVFDRKQAKHAYSDAAQLIWQAMSSIDTRSLHSSHAVHQATLQILQDPALTLALETRHVLELNSQAYDFFTTTPTPAPAPAQPMAPTPSIS